VLQSCYDLLMSEEWKIETTSSNGDEVSYMQLPKEGKIMKITVNRKGWNFVKDKIPFFSKVFYFLNSWSSIILGCPQCICQRVDQLFIQRLRTFTSMEQTCHGSYEVTGTFLQLLRLFSPTFACNTLHYISNDFIFRISMTIRISFTKWQAHMAVGWLRREISLFWGIARNVAIFISAAVYRFHAHQSRLAQIWLGEISQLHPLDKFICAREDIRKSIIVLNLFSFKGWKWRKLFRSGRVIQWN